MKKITKRIIRKTMEEKIYDTKKFRYVLRNRQIIACEMWKIGEKACLQPGAWKVVYEF